MNKWAGTSAFVASLLLSGGAFAQSSYIGIAGGQGHQDVDCTGVPSCKDTGTALKFTAGSTFAQTFAMEVGYLDFGKVKASGFGSSLQIKVSALTLAAAFKAPLTPDLALHARVGVASVKTKGELRGAFNDNASETKAKPLFGAGVSFAVSNSVAIEAGADFTKAELEGDKADVRAITIGLRFSF